MDPEIQAMSDCYLALQNLDNDSRGRVIGWLASKFNINQTLGNLSVKGAQKDEGLPFHDQGQDRTTPPGSTSETNITDFENVADIFAKANPKTDADKVLVVATFLQLKNSLQDFASFDVQKELKHLGHGVTNITTSMGILEGKKPKLIIQTRKEGKSRQAKKKYKVTQEGIKTVKEFLNNQ
jgi:hypothetical protein